MPSEAKNIQEQGFRSSLFGFDKNDVLAYMNALADEAQQHEMEYEQKLRRVQSELETLRSERADTDARVKAVQAEADAASQRADMAESKRRESEEKLEDLQKQLDTYQSGQKESQKNANYWQLKCHDLQQQVDELQKQLTAARQLNASATPTPKWSARPNWKHARSCRMPSSTPKVRRRSSSSRPIPRKAAWPKTPVALPPASCWYGIGSPGWISDSMLRPWTWTV